MSHEKLESEILKIIEDQRNDWFSILGIRTKELMHSRFIAFLLAPNGQYYYGDSQKEDYIKKHEYNGKFLKFFIEKFTGVKELDFDNAKVYIEYDIGEYGRVDILIEFTNYRIVIENKIFATDQPDQMNRYNEWLKNKRDEDKKEFDLIYLTLDGRKASKDSASELKLYTKEKPKDSYLCIAYKSLEDEYGDLRSWLCNCSEVLMKEDDLKKYITDYIKTIDQLTISNKISNIIIKENNYSCLEKLLTPNEKAGEYVKVNVQKALDDYLYSYIYETKIKCKIEKLKKTNEEIYFEDNICYLYITSKGRTEYDIVFMFETYNIVYFPLCITYNADNKKKYSYGKKKDDNNWTWVNWKKEKSQNQKILISDFITKEIKELENETNSMRNCIKKKIK